MSLIVLCVDTPFATDTTYVHCDFERESCGLDQESGDEEDWTRLQAELYDSAGGKDHTTLSGR